MRIFANSDSLHSFETVALSMRFLFILVLFCLFSKLSAQQTILLDEKKAYYRIGWSMRVLEDKTNQLTFGEVSSSYMGSLFKPTTQEIPNFGYSLSAYWFKMNIRNDPHNRENWLLQLAHPLVDTITVFFVETATGNLLYSKRTGSWFAFESREFRHNTYIFNIPFEKASEITIYIQCKGKNSKQFPFYIFSEKYFIEQDGIESTVLGIYIGVFLAMICYNFFVYLSLRSRSYLYYILFISGFLLMQLALNGYLHEFTPEKYIFIAILSNLFFVGFTIYWGVQFARHFLRIKRFAVRMHYFLYGVDGMTIVLMIGTVLSVFLPNLLKYLPSLASFSAFTIAILLLPTSGYILYTGFRPARFYVLAWSALLIGIIIYVLRNAGYLPNNLLTTSSVRLGSLVEIILLSMGLADRINISEQEKRTAQQKMIATLKEKEQMISEQNRILEETVKKRTLEISEKNKTLEKQNEEIISQRDLVELQRVELSKALQELRFRNQEVISSINYAQRIQNAMLPQIEEVKLAFQKRNGDVFILFKPRDIVSGDFYWMIEKEPYLILAVADCTGHGVPGAIMSMIGNDLLNEIVGLREIYSADKILHELHLGIRSALRQKETQNNDGMDVSILVIDCSKKMMQYAGAVQPLIYFQQNQLFYLKGDRLSVGGVQREMERFYTKHLISLQHPTTFYLFSDGYQDQFGGVHNKKFMIKRLRKLLSEIHQLPIHQQHQVLQDTIAEWTRKGNEKQIDDILMLGGFFI